jgi:gamma-glutamylcyclotransferase (GGCT)/AIG2-like uncharacterized protein YtfP
MNVFTYGSLMFPDVWRAVVKGQYSSTAGEVNGYLRRCVKQQTYPGLIRGVRHDVVVGRVYFNIDAIDLARLDRFEGTYYRREKVDVLLEDGARVNAELYLFKDAYRGLLESRDWDAAWFEREGLARFLRGYKGFNGR